MVDALTHTNLGGGLVCHGAEGEGKRREPLVHLDEECSRTFHLKVVDLLKLALEDGAAGFVLSRLTISGGDEDVEADNIAWSELELGDVVAWGSPVDDDIVAVNDMSLDLVGKDTLNSVALELFGDSLNNFSNLGIGGSLSDFALSGLERVVGGQDDVSLAASDGSVTNDDGGGGVGSVAIEVRSANAAQNKDYNENVSSFLIINVASTQALMIIDCARFH